MAATKRPRPPQANVPLTPHDEDVLRALMFLEGRPASEILRPAIERFLREQEKDQEVRDALALLKRHRDKAGGTNLTPFRQTRSTRGGA